MQIIAHGIDLVDCKRIEDMLERHDERFLNRIYTPMEQQYSGQGKHRIERLAARFAAKEAVLKLIGTGWRGKIAWTDIEVVNTPLGQPEVKMTGEARTRAEQLGIQCVSISLTHAADLAIASAVALGQAYEDK